MVEAAHRGYAPPPRPSHPPSFAPTAGTSPLPGRLRTNLGSAHSSAHSTRAQPRGAGRAPGKCGARLPVRGEAMVRVRDITSTGPALQGGLARATVGRRSCRPEALKSGCQAKWRQERGEEEGEARAGGRAWDWVGWRLRGAGVWTGSNDCLWVCFALEVRNLLVTGKHGANTGNELHIPDPLHHIVRITADE